MIMRITASTKKAFIVAAPLLLLLALVVGAGYAILPLPMLALSIMVPLALVVYRMPIIGVLLVTFALPLERLGAYETGVGTIKPSQLLAAFTLVCWVAHVVWRKQKTFRPNPLVVPLLVFLAVCTISLTRALNVRYSSEALMLTSFTILISWLVPQIVTTRMQLRRLLIVLCASAVLVSVFGLFQFFGDLAGLPTTVTGLRELYTKDVFGFPRIQSTALEPLYFANFLLIPIGVVYAFLLERKARVPLWITWVTLGMLGINLVLTVSRGAFIAAFGEVILISFIAWRSLLRPRIFIPLILGVVAVAWVAARSLSAGDTLQMNRETFLTHVQNVFYGASYNERVYTIERAQEAFWRSPIIGIGPAGFGPYAAEHPLVKPKSGWLIVNNETIELLAETGIAGTLCIVVALVLLILRSIKALRRARDPLLRAALAGFFGAFVGIIIQYQTFSTLYIMHVWFLVGLLITVQNLILVGEKSS